MAERGLGKGLGALFGEESMAPAREGGAILVPLHKVEARKNQPRRYFDPEALEELAESIRVHGVLQPITVRQLPSGYYQIIAGERRWRAARLAGLTEVPVLLVEADDRKAMELAMIENLQREDLNPVEEAAGYRCLMDEYGMTQEEAAQRVGKSRPAVANALRLLALPKEVLLLLENGSLSAGHARALLGLKDDRQQKALASQILEKDISVRQTELLVKRLNQQTGREDAPESPVTVLTVDYLADLERQLTTRLGRKVKITHGRRKGKLELEYYGEDDLENLLQLLRQERKGGGSFGG